MTNKILKRSVLSGLALIFTFLLLTLSNTANASHYRYGNISWSRANTTTRTVTFTVTQAWRKSAFPGVVLGGTVNPGTPLNFGDATSANVILTVTSINNADDWFYGTYTVAHTYAGTATTFTASYSSCCRIGSPLQNNANGNMASQSIVNLVAGNTGSPVSTMPPIINLSTGNSAATFNIPASDPDGTTVTYSLATGAQVGSGWVNLAGFSVNASTGVATFNTVGKAVGNLYSTAVVVTDAHGSKTIVDFIIKIVNTSTPPVFDYAVTPSNSYQYNVTPGQTVNFNVRALDTDIGSTVTLSVVGLAAGMSLSPALPVTSNPVSTAFSWTPNTGQLGLYVLNFTAQDNIGTQTQTSVRIYVSMNPTFVVPPTPIAGSDRLVFSGALHTDVIQANNPDVSVLTRINSATLPAGASVTPTLPSAYAVSPSVTFNWTPTPAQFGVNTITFTALDQNGRSATHSYDLIVNTLPAFTSTPIETAEACVPYSYTVTASDANMPYGDVVNINSPNLPSWLTITNTGNGTAVLSGTPSSSDIGTYTIQLEAADIYHHGNNVHVHQEFDIVVADSYAPSFACPANISLSSCQSVASWTVNASDNCGIASIVSTPASGSSFNYGTTTVSVVVTDVNGNVSNCSFDVVRAAELTATASATSILCNGGTSTVTVAANGGTAPYSGDGNFTVTAGNYNYTVTDANGCSVSVSGNVAEPTALTASSSATAILCNGGTSTVTVAANGGTAPYSGDGNFTVSAGNYAYTVTDVNGCSTTTSGSVSEPTALSASSSATAILCNGGTSTVTVAANGGTAPYSGDGNFTVTAGNYSYTVTDANGCATSTSGSVSEPTALVVNSSASAILCNGGSSTVAVVANGGTTPYSGDGNFTVTAGNYNYTVTDANGCSASTSGNVTEPSALVVSSSSTAILCNGGTSTVTVAANGGTAPYSGDGNFTVTAGNYNYTVTDANGCSASTSGNVTEPSALVVSSSSTAILCNGGSSTVAVVANGGTTPYSGDGNFTVTAGNYNYTVTDANGCSASTSGNVTEPTALAASATSGSIACNGGTTTVAVTANGGTAPYSGDGSFTVGAGTHTYTVTDANGCSVTTSITVSEPTLLTASSASGSIACNGGTTTVTVSANGGTAPYSGDGSYTVAAGTHSYTVTDANGCSTNTSITVGEPSVLTASSTSGSIACNGGTTTVTVAANGGTAPYSGTGNFTVGAGSYSYTVTDANGCTAVTTITIGQPSTLTASIGALSTQPLNTCAFGYAANIVLGYGGGPTSVTLNGSATGGTGNKTYSWSPAAGLSNPNIANPVFTPTTPTGCALEQFTLTVTDANGCTATQTISVAVANVRTANSNPNSPKVNVCHNASSQEIDITVSVNAVPAHMTHCGSMGCDCLGDCQDNCDAAGRGQILLDVPMGTGVANVYPNPNDGNFFLDFMPVYVEETTIVEVVDVNGKVVFSQQLAPTEEVHMYLELGSDVCPGVYFVKIINGEYSNTQKIVNEQ